MPRKKKIPMHEHATPAARPGVYVDVDLAHGPVPPRSKSAYRRLVEAGMPASEAGRKAIELGMTLAEVICEHEMMFVEGLLPPEPVTEAMLDEWAEMNPPKTRERMLEEIRTEPGFRSVPVRDARPLVTIGPEHSCWRLPEVPVGCRGMIVRVRPPESASDADVALVEAGIAGSGALAVKVERRRGRKVVDAQAERKPHARARDVVLSLAARANVRDRERFSAFLEGVMARASL